MTDLNSRLSVLEKEVDKYNRLTDEVRIDRYNSLTEEIDEFSKEVKNTRGRFMKKMVDNNGDNGDKTKTGKVVSAKSYKKAYLRYQEISNELNKDLSIEVMMELYDELKTVKNKMGRYLGRGVEVVEV